MVDAFPRHAVPSFRKILSALAAAATLAVAGCGGGGGGDSAAAPAETPSSTTGPLPPSDSVANVCTATGQKSFVRSYMDEAYLWFDEIPQVDPAAHASVTSYFDALRVRSLDANGVVKDRFSTAMTASQADAWLSSSDATPMAAAGGSNGPVPQSKVVTSPAGRRTGYIQFNDHSSGAQDALIDAFAAMRTAGVQDLVLDMRYNSGGYLYIAAAAAAMVAGPANEGAVFEKLQYNTKRTSDTANSFMLFSGQVAVGETKYPRGTLLPQLGLPRLYVLTSSLTCSASESIINGLRGIDVQVVLVGGTTCGKPYGFTRKDNCGYAYFPIEFEGRNAKDFGAYSTGFQANCKVAGDATKTLGNTDEPLLAAALTHIDTGACPAGSVTGAEMSVDPLAGTAPAVQRPPWAGRLIAR